MYFRSSLIFSSLFFIIICMLICYSYQTAVATCLNQVCTTPAEIQAGAAYGAQVCAASSSSSTTSAASSSSG